MNDKNSLSHTTCQNEVQIWKQEDKLADQMSMKE